MTLPTPPRRTGSVSKSKARLPATNMAGREISKDGDHSSPKEIGRDSGRNHCIATAAAISTSTIDPSTARLLRDFATVYNTFDMGVAARIRPTRVVESRSTEFFTT